MRAGPEGERLINGSLTVVGPNVLDRNPAYGDASSISDVIFRNCADSTLNGLHLNGARLHREASYSRSPCT
jgi:hypothetical protein